MTQHYKKIERFRQTSGAKPLDSDSNRQPKCLERNRDAQFMITSINLHHQPTSRASTAHVDVSWESWDSFVGQQPVIICHPWPMAHKFFMFIANEIRKNSPSDWPHEWLTPIAFIQAVNLVTCSMSKSPGLQALQALQGPRLPRCVLTCLRSAAGAAACSANVGCWFVDCIMVDE